MRASAHTPIYRTPKINGVPTPGGTPGEEVIPTSNVFGAWIEADDTIAGTGTVYQQGFGNGTAGALISFNTTTVPSGALMVVCLTVVDSSAWTPPAGWTVVFDDRLVAVPRPIVYYKVKAAETSVSFTKGGVNLGQAGILMTAIGPTTATASARDYDTSGSVTIPSAPAGSAVFMYATVHGTPDIAAYAWSAIPGYTLLAAGARTGAANRLRVEAVSAAGGASAGFSINEGGTSARVGFSLGLN